jgi:hypothetical protein
MTVSSWPFVTTEHTDQAGLGLRSQHGKTRSEAPDRLRHAPAHDLVPDATDRAWHLFAWRKIFADVSESKGRSLDRRGNWWAHVDTT